MAELNFPHGGNIYEVQRSYRKEVVDFSANINPLGLSEKLKAEFRKCLSKIIHYPDPAAKELIKVIADYWEISEDNILVGNGSTELIYLIAYAFKPKTAFIPVPTFSEYERALNLVGSKIKFLPLHQDDFQLPEVPTGFDLSFIGNPNNPTGNLLLKERKFALDKSKLNVIDEAFMDFLPEEKSHTFIGEAIKNKKIIVLRSFTKFFALPGLRIGYLIAHRDLIRDLKSFQPPWSVNTVAQLLASVALKDQDYINRTRALITAERDYLFQELSQIAALKPYPSVANFLLVEILAPRITAFFLRESLLLQDILIRDGSNFRGLNEKYFRVAVRSHKENRKLIKELKKLL